MPDLGNSMGIPFEEGPLGQNLDLEAWISGGVVVMAAVVPVGPDQKPALVWRFTSPTGTFLAPIVLILDDDQARNLVPLVTKAVRAATRAAKEAS